MTEKQPTLFVPHGGGPCFFMDWNPPDAWDRHRKFLEDLPASLPARPKALLVISGHWEERVFTLQTNCHCTLINQILRIGSVFGRFCTLNCNISTGRCVSG